MASISKRIIERNWILFVNYCFTLMTTVQNFNSICRSRDINYLVKENKMKRFRTYVDRSFFSLFNPYNHLTELCTRIAETPCICESKVHVDFPLTNCNVRWYLRRISLENILVYHTTKCSLFILRVSTEIQSILNHEKLCIKVRLLTTFTQ